MPIHPPAEQIPLVNSSADYYSTGPLIPRLRRGWRIVVIVKAARLHGHEIERLPALPVVQYAHGIDLCAISVFRVWIRCHVVSSRVLVHEQHACPDRNRELLRADTARGQRESVGIDWRGRRTSARRCCRHRTRRASRHRSRTRIATADDYPSLGQQWQSASRVPRARGDDNLLDGDPSFQIGILRIVVIVIAAAAGICETERGLRLASLTAGRRLRSKDTRCAPDADRIPCHAIANRC